MLQEEEAYTTHLPVPSAGSKASLGKFTIGSTQYYMTEMLADWIIENIPPGGNWSTVSAPDWAEPVDQDAVIVMVSMAGGSAGTAKGGLSAGVSPVCTSEKA